MELSHLDQLENQSLYIFREAYHAFGNLCMPWSMGKDSNVLIWLAKKAFGGNDPLPRPAYRHHLRVSGDAGISRTWATKEYDLNLIVKINEEARFGRGVGYETHDPVTVTHELKTVALQQALARVQVGRLDYRYPPR